MIKLLLVVLINCVYFTNARPDVNTEVPDLTLKKETKSEDLATIPIFNFDFVSILKTLAKYEVHEETKPAIKKIDLQAAEVKTETNSAIKQIQTIAEEVKTETYGTIKQIQTIAAEVKAEINSMKKQIQTIASGAYALYPQSIFDIVTLEQQKYYLSVEKLAWTEAVAFCRKYGMELWTWESKEEKDLIVNHIKKNNATPDDLRYISANKVGSNKSDWTLLNSETFVSYEWKPGQPDNVGKGFCMYFVPSENGKVGDIWCKDALLFICKGH